MKLYNTEELEIKLYRAKTINFYLTVALVISIMFNIAPSQAASLYAPDGTYLGELSANQFDPNSTSNPYGKYGSEYSSTSINNPYSKYGSEFSSQSPNNPYSTATTVQPPSLYEQ
jgi:hypothetical protein